MRSPYLIWKEKFTSDHNCTQGDFFSTVISSSVPHLLSIVLVCGFVAFGTFVFRFLDEKIANEPFYEALLFSYTTITTIGYGKVVPRNSASQMFCVFYCILGIPMVFLTLSNMGEFVAEFYWICVKAIFDRKEKDDFEKEYRLPLTVVSTLITFHSLMGGFIFHFWIDEMPIIPAIYFSFVSITTIGYGDLNPSPDNGFHTIVLIIYLSTGIVIMSTLFGALSGHLREYSKNLYSDDDNGRLSKSSTKRWSNSSNSKTCNSQNTCAKSCDVNQYLCYKV